LQKIQFGGVLPIPAPMELKFGDDEWITTNFTQSVKNFAYTGRKTPKSAVPTLSQSSRT